MRISDWSSDVCSSDLKVRHGRAVVEFGSGSSAKTPLLLRAIAPAAYVPIDISGDFLRDAAAALAQDFPDLPVIPVEADFMEPIALPEAIRDLPKLGFFPGSTIGHLVPRSEEHTSELQSLMRISYAVFCLKKKTRTTQTT